jgi:hypothetical protein
MRNQARYRRREADRITLRLTRAEAVETLALVLGATLAENDAEQQAALASVTVKVAAELPS